MQNPDYEVVGVTRDLSSIDEVDAEPDYIEFQLDLADEPVEQLERYDDDIPLIASWSSSESVDAELPPKEDTVIDAAKCECVEMVDLLTDDLKQSNIRTIELESAEVDIIATCRDPDETPPMDELKGHIEEAAELGEVAKVITFANSREDSLNLLDALNSTSQSGLSVAGYCMGEAGEYTRVMAIIYGSMYCYGGMDSSIRESNNPELELNQLFETLDTVLHGGDDVVLMDGLKEKFS